MIVLVAAGAVPYETPQQLVAKPHVGSVGASPILTSSHITCDVTLVCAVILSTTHYYTEPYDYPSTTAPYLVLFESMILDLATDIKPKVGSWREGFKLLVSIQNRTVLIMCSLSNPFQHEYTSPIIAAKL